MIDMLKVKQVEKVAGYLRDLDDWIEKKLSADTKQIVIPPEDYFAFIGLQKKLREMLVEHLNEACKNYIDSVK